jgi:hypothetical protein
MPIVPELWQVFELARCLPPAQQRALAKMLERHFKDPITPLPPPISAKPIADVIYLDEHRSSVRVDAAKKNPPL